MKKIKIALIGCGRISYKHFEAIKKIKNLELLAICDTNKKKLILPEYKIKKYTNIDDLLKVHKHELDIISICTPSGFHKEHTIKVLKNKINVICEKPMALNYLDGVKMVKNAKKNNVNLYIVKQNRFNPTLIELKKHVDQKKFGKIRLVTVNVFWNRDQNYYNQAKWRGTKKLDGGAIMNQASHYVDLICWLFGGFKQLMAFKSKIRQIQTEDTAVINFKLKKDIIGSLNVTMCTPNKNFEGSITIIGEKGLVKIGGIALNKINHWEFDKSDHTPRVDYDIKNVYGNGHLPMYESIANKISKNKDKSNHNEENLKTLKFLTSIYRSFYTKKIIKN